MTFFKKDISRERTEDASQVKDEAKKRSKLKKVLAILGITLAVALIAGIGFLVASGSKIFENGFGGGTGLLKTIYGGQELKGKAEDRTNILLMGMGGAGHPGGYLTDSMMIVSYRESDKKVALLSIPRDLFVPIPGHDSGKINGAFAAGYNDYMTKDCKKKNQSACLDDALAAGANLTSKTVSEVFDLNIHYYATVDFNGFQKIIDDLGGIDVFVDKAIYDPYYPSDDMIRYSPFSITAGQHHLNGKEALKYARSRHTTSDFDRASRQQKIIQAAKEKAGSLGFLSNPKKITDVISTLGDSIKTNFSPAELRTFATHAKDISGSAVTKVLSNSTDGLLIDGNNGSYILKPRTGNFKQIQEFARNIFETNPDESAKIGILNGSKTSGLAGTLGKELETDYGYRVTNIGTVKLTGESKTVIYDFSDGKNPITISFLEKKLGVGAQKKKDPGATVDIQIVIGDDYNLSN